MPHSLLTLLEEAERAECLVRLSLSEPKTAAEELRRLTLRPALIKRERKLSFTYHYRTRDIVKNHSLAEAVALLAPLLAEQFQRAELCTTRADYRWTRRGTTSTVVAKPPAITEPPNLAHDRTKQRVLDSVAKPYLAALGITDAQGVVRAKSQDKYRQIHRYIELLDPLLRALPARDTPLRIADMGAGKGYLTFALYDHLAAGLKRPVQLMGVELRPELVEAGNRLAQAQHFAGLSFVAARIETFDWQPGLDVLIALHACDTATDDALALGIRAGATLLVVAPCCHKQLRPLLAPPPSETALNALLQHGTYADRLAEMATDHLRTLLLEAQGYKTKLFEFISDSHTPKNMMITAQKYAASDEDRTRALAAYHAAKAAFGVSTHALEARLGG